MIAFTIHRITRGVSEFVHTIILILVCDGFKISLNEKKITSIKVSTVLTLFLVKDKETAKRSTPQRCRIDKEAMVDMV